MPRDTEQEVRNAVAAARSLSEALRTLGLRPAGGNHRTLHKLIAKYGISTDHMDPRWALRRAPRNTATPLPEVLIVDSAFHRGHLKQRLFHEGVKKRRCELCGLGDEWHGEPMSLILDHINGVPTDNRIENLRIVCPNLLTAVRLPQQGLARAPAGPTEGAATGVRRAPLRAPDDELRRRRPQARRLGQRRAQVASLLRARARWAQTGRA